MAGKRKRSRPVPAEAERALDEALDETFPASDPVAAEEPARAAKKRRGKMADEPNPVAQPSKPARRGRR